MLLSLQIINMGLWILNHYYYDDVDLTAILVWWVSCPAMISPRVMIPFHPCGGRGFGPIPSLSPASEAEAPQT